MVFRKLIDYVSYWNDVHETEFELQSMSDHQLADLGIPRGRIREFALKRSD